MATATIQITQGSIVGGAGQSVIGLNTTSAITLTDAGGAGATSYLWEVVSYPGPNGAAPAITNGTSQVATITPAPSLTDGVYIVRLTRNDMVDGVTIQLRFFAVADDDGLSLPSAGMTRDMTNIGGQATAQEAGWFGRSNASTNVFLDAYLRLRKKREGRYLGRLLSSTYVETEPTTTTFQWAVDRPVQYVMMAGLGNYVANLSRTGAEDGASFKFMVRLAPDCGTFVLQNAGETILEMPSPSAGLPQYKVEVLYDGTDWRVFDVGLSHPHTALGTLASNMFHEHVAVAGVQETDQGTFQKIGILSIDPTLFPSGSTAFEAVFETTDAANPAEVRLVERVSNSVITTLASGGSTGIKTLSASVELPETKVQYEVQLRLTNTDAAQRARCYRATVTTRWGTSNLAWSPESATTATLIDYWIGDAGITKSTNTVETWAAVKGVLTTTTPGTTNPQYLDAGTGRGNGVDFNGTATTTEDRVDITGLASTAKSYTFVFGLNQRAAGTQAPQPLFHSATGPLTCFASRGANQVGYNDGANKDIAAAIDGEQTLIWTFDAGATTGRVYRNGELLGQAAYTPRDLGQAPDTRNFIGIALDLNHFNGIVWRAAIFTGAMSADEVRMAHAWALPPRKVDAILINGQSNAVASSLRSGTTLPAGIAGADILTWNAMTSALVTGDPDNEGDPDFIGQWGAKLGRILADSHGRNVVVLNQAVSGQAIAYFLPGNPSNNYTDLKARVTASKVSPRIMLWAQGEQDAAAGTTYADYLAALETLRTNWLADYPTLERIVVFKTAVGACGANTTTVRQAQEDFAAAHADVVLVDLDDLTGTAAHTGCHYTYPGGYEVFALRGFHVTP